MLSWDLLHGGVPCWCDQGSPRAPAARRGCALLGGGSPSSIPPSAAARVSRGQQFGGTPCIGLSSVGLLHSESLLGAPLWILSPFAWGVTRCSVWGSPPMPSLCAVGARCWLRVSPPPSPLPPPKLAARVRRGRPFGGGLYSVSLPSGSRATLTRRGFSSPPFSRVRPALWVVAPWPSSPVADPRWLGLSLKPPTPPCCTHGAGACRFWS